MFTDMSGNLATAWKKSPSWPYITNLRRDPYERFYGEGKMYLRWFGSRMFLMGPVQDLVAKQLKSTKEFPPARGSSLSLGVLLDDITYQAGSASQ